MTKNVPDVSLTIPRVKILFDFLVNMSVVESPF